MCHEKCPYRHTPRDLGQFSPFFPVHMGVDMQHRTTGIKLQRLEENSMEEFRKKSDSN